MEWLSTKWALIPSALGAMGLGGLITKLLDFKTQSRKQSDGLALELVSQLTNRVGVLEARISAQAKSHSTHIEILRQLHEGEIALVRHRLNGEAQINIALMTVLETLDVPQRTLDAINASRARMQEAIAAEQAEMTKLRASAIDRLAKLMEPAE